MSTAHASMLSLFLYSENLSGSLVQEPFQLATEKRAKERQEMEKKMAEMEAWKMQQLEEVRQQEEEQQKEELARLRRELVIDWAACALMSPVVSVVMFSGGAGTIYSASAWTASRCE